MTEDIEPTGADEPTIVEARPATEPPKAAKKKAAKTKPVATVVEPDVLDDIERIETVSHELPTRKFLCSIPKARDKALEAKTEIEAVTAADAREKYMAHMGIVKVEGDIKVVVQEG